MMLLSFFTYFAAVTLAIIFARFLWAIMPLLFCCSVAVWFASGHDGSFDQAHFWHVFMAMTVALLALNPLRTWMVKSLFLPSR